MAILLHSLKYLHYQRGILKQIKNIERNTDEAIGFHSCDRMRLNKGHWSKTRRVIQ